MATICVQTQINQINFNLAHVHCNCISFATLVLVFQMVSTPIRMAFDSLVHFYWFNLSLLLFLFRCCSFDNSFAYNLNVCVCVCSDVPIRVEIFHFMARGSKKREKQLIHGLLSTYIYPKWRDAERLTADNMRYTHIRLLRPPNQLTREN